MPSDYDIETKEIESIRKVVVPWIEVNPLDYQPWDVTLSTGLTITVWAPLGAAVELEEKGWPIKHRGY